MLPEKYRDLQTMMPNRATTDAVDMEQRLLIINKIEKYFDMTVELNYDPPQVPDPICLIRRQLGLFVGIIIYWPMDDLYKKIADVFDRDHVDEDGVSLLYDQLRECTVVLFHMYQNTPRASRETSPQTTRAQSRETSLNNLPLEGEGVDAVGLVVDPFQAPVAETVQVSEAQQVVMPVEMKLRQACIKRDNIPEHQPPIDSIVPEVLRSCLFCFEQLTAKAVHIIAQNKNVIKPHVEVLLKEANLKSLYDVQNGLSLCHFCHLMFDRCMLFVEVDTLREEDAYYLRTITPSVSTNYDLICYEEVVAQHRKAFVEKYPEKSRLVRDGYGLRIYMNPEMREQWPSPKALQFHQATCMLWRLMGGAEDQDEDYFDDYDRYASEEYYEGFGDYQEEWLVAHEAKDYSCNFRSS